MESNFKRLVIDVTLADSKLGTTLVLSLLALASCIDYLHRTSQSTEYKVIEDSSSECSNQIIVLLVAYLTLIPLTIQMPLAICSDLNLQSCVMCQLSISLPFANTCTFVYINS